MATTSTALERMLADGVDFMDAACMAASWQIAELCLGPEEPGSYSMDRDAIEVGIQEILREVFGAPKES